MPANTLDETGDALKLWADAEKETAPRVGARNTPRVADSVRDSHMTRIWRGNREIDVRLQLGVDKVLAVYARRRARRRGVQHEVLPQLAHLR